MSAFGRLARLPKYIRAIRKLIEKLYLGALQGAQKELVKFPNSAFMALATAAVLVAEVADGTSAALWPQTNTISSLLSSKKATDRRPKGQPSNPTAVRIRKSAQHHYTTFPCMPYCALYCTSSRKIETTSNNILILVTE